MKLAGQRILVAGASGFIGRNLALRLAAEGVQVRASYNTRRPDLPASVDVAQADLRTKEACAAIVAGMDVVFMCAAATSGAAVIRATPLAHVTPNVLMNTLMLEAAYEAGVKRFVFLSTGAVYPFRGTHAMGEDEVMDGPPHESYYAAGWMKRYIETLCRTYAEKVSPAMSTVVVRPSNIYGPFDKFGRRTSHVTAAQIRKVFERQAPVEVWGTGEDLRDLIYIDDFIEGLIAAASTDRGYLEVNIASGTAVSVLDILRTAMAVDGYETEIRLDPAKPSTIPALLFDTRRAREELGFEARTPLAEGIRRTLAWLRSTPESLWDR